MSERVARRMTVDEFLTWQPSQQDRYELVDGQPVAMTGAKLRHDRVTANALAEIQRQLRAAGNPCDAFTDDIAILTRPGQLRRPDVSVLCPPFDEEAMVSDRPRLIVEVLSDSTEQVDRLMKLEEYKSLPSLDYMVLADPARIDVGFWYRDAARGWRTQPFHDADRVIEMPALGLAIGIATLYERVRITHRPRPRLIWDDTGTP